MVEFSRLQRGMGHLVRRAVVLALLWALFVAGRAIADTHKARHALATERTANVERIQEIVRKVRPLAGELQGAVNAIEDHNKGPKPDPRDRAAVEAYNAESLRLQARKDGLVGRIDALQTELNRLVARDKEIDAALESMGPVFTQAAAEFVKTLSDVAQKLDLPKGPPTDRRLASLNCQAFFRGVAADLKRRGKSTWQDDFPDMNADAIAKKLEDVAAKGGNWRETTMADAQGLADEGAIVVGASRRDKSGYGHLGFAFPIPADVDPDQFHGRGPFVRDGNEHSLKTGTGRRLALSTWGAVRASNAFDVSRTKWYVWMPSKP